jgi:tryptophan synthase alpha chain
VTRADDAVGLRRAFPPADADDEAGFVAYVMAGDPTPERSVDYAEAVLEAGADAIELGVPYSDPIADGPTIQAAGVRAREAGTTLEDVLHVLEELRRRRDEPVAPMTYYNPILQRGEAAFAEEVRQHGGDGLVVPDLPLEESASLQEATAEAEIDLVQLASPLTEPDRMARLAEATQGFLYLVSTTGVTGARSSVEERTRRLVREAKKETGDVPVAVGFGVSEPEHAATLREAGADGVVVGSAIVDRIADEQDPDEVGAFVRDLADAAHGPG